MYSDFKDIQIEKFNRIIVDEIHELYSNPNYRSILEKCFKTGCQYKWGISATPFPVPNSIFNLIRFLTEKDLYYNNMDRFIHFYDTYYKIFRKNTLNNIVKEIRLPKSVEYNMEKYRYNITEYTDKVAKNQSSAKKYAKQNK